jgi:predicted lipid-binding transport protein (Tim44 family)
VFAIGAGVFLVIFTWQGLARSAPARSRGRRFLRCSASCGASSGRQEKPGRTTTAFLPERVHAAAEQLFRDAQNAWDAGDRARLATLLDADLLVEWERRLDDFDPKGWHNRAEVLGDVRVEYVGITNREEAADNRVVVPYRRDTPRLRGRSGRGKDPPQGRDRRHGRSLPVLDAWPARGALDPALDRRASRGRAPPQRADRRLALVGRPAPARRGVDRDRDRRRASPGYKPADLVDLDFAADARGAALDLAVADARFAPDVLEAAARGMVEAWAQAVDGDDAPLEHLASRSALRALLYEGDNTEKTRVVVRGPRVKRLSIVVLDAKAEPATMTIEVELGGRRYVQDRDTAAVLSASKDDATVFTERWTLSLDGPESHPWRLTAVSDRVASA